MATTMSQRWHRNLGIVLVLPLLLWAATGAVFLFKPGYGGAYEQLRVSAAAPQCAGVSPAQGPWQELRMVSSVLGCHQLQKLQGSWQHLQADGSEWQPNASQVSTLLASMTVQNSARYGQIVSVELAGQQWRANTSTGVELTLNWADLSVRQQGRDSRLINTLYKIHYLQPFTIKWANQAFASLILLLLVIAVTLGIWLLWRRSQGA